MKKKGLHAVYFVEEQRAMLYNTWEEADQAMRGRPHLNKKVYSKEEAVAWVEGITLKDIARAKLYSQPKPRALPKAYGTG